MSASPPNAEPRPEPERLAGLVERVTFHNADSGFCVLRLKVKGERELITLVGHTPTVAPGEYASASGTWVTDREHGRQFKAVFVKISPPNTLTGIERYLGSGMVKGIGPVYAGRLVKAFGAAVFDIIEQTPERLREVEGIGAIRARKITSGWADQKIIREIMVFLHGNGVSTSRAVRIFKTYGQDRTPSLSSRKILIGWPGTFVASASCRPTPSPRRSVSHMTPRCVRGLASPTRCRKQPEKATAACRGANSCRLP
jgi:exodeoxyribonuclease V alpha subunit